MSDSQKRSNVGWSDGSRFVNSDGGITVSGDGEGPILWPPGLRYDKNGNPIIPPGWEFNESTEGWERWEVNKTTGVRERVEY
jgi:hypothetical protein